MKKILYFLSLLLVFVSGVMAQNVNIPDPNFKNALLNHNPIIDTNGDGEIQVSEAQAVDSLNVLINNISDMTGIEAFVNLTYLSCTGNQLTNLDVSNNTALVSLLCDFNYLTSLDVSNNTALYYLDCYKNQLTSLDVSNNTSLEKLYCGLNYLTSLDVSNNTALDTLYCYNNQLTSLDVLNNPALTALMCNENQLASLDVSNNTALNELVCQNNDLTSLDVSNNTALIKLWCASNLLTSLDVSNNTALTELSCYSNPLTSLDVSNNTALIDLACSANQLTSLDVSNNTALIKLSCGYNSLTSLDVSNNTLLNELICRNNQLTSLDVSNNTLLYELICGNNQLTSLDVSNNIALNELVCQDNDLTSLDVSNNTALGYLHCYANQLTGLDLSNNTALHNLFCYDNPMTALFLKNGRDHYIPSLSNCPNLTYVCADSAEIAYVQSMVPSALVGTFCTYAPGSNYNTLSGQTSLDVDMNGCTPTDSKYPFMPILVNDGINIGYLYTNQQGNYLAYLDSGNFSLTPQVSNPTYFSANTANISFPNSNNNTLTQDLCITPNGSFPDVEITFIPINPARPGFDSDYEIQYKNIGTTTANGDITLEFQENKMSFLSASTAPTNQTANQLTWTYSNLQPFEVRTIDITMNILPPPTNNINDIITTVANISLTNDFNPTDIFLPSIKRS